MITVLTCRGTAEPLGGSANMLTYVTAYLDKDRFAIGEDVSYLASIGPVNEHADLLGGSEAQSIESGLETLAAAIRGCPNLVGLLGYSLGAELVSTFLERHAQGLYPDCQVAWAGLVANPNRAEGEGIDANPQGWGINGQHARWPDIPVWTAANPLDAITSCPGDSPLRALADGVSGFTFALQDWSATLADQLRQRRLQPVTWGWWRNPIGTWKLYVQAAELMEGYLFDYEHTGHYIADGYCARLAEEINAHALT